MGLLTSPCNDLLGSLIISIDLSSPLKAAAHACSLASVVADDVAPACIRYIKLKEIIESSPIMIRTPTNAMPDLNIDLLKHVLIIDFQLAPLNQHYWSKHFVVAGMLLGFEGFF